LETGVEIRMVCWGGTTIWPWQWWNQGSVSSGTRCNLLVRSYFLFGIWILQWSSQYYRIVTTVLLLPSGSTSISGGVMCGHLAIRSISHDVSFPKETNY
jgi:hypothetical protein